MTLQTKTTITIVLTVCTITLLLYAMLYASIMSEYISLDEEINLQNVERAFREIDYRLNSLRTLTDEWAAWDDTYLYLAGENPTFLEDNIFDISFSTLNINYMLFYDVAGNFFHGTGYDTDNNHYIDIPLEFKNIFKNNTFFKERLGRGIVGIVSSQGKFLLMCALPIQKNDWKDPNGTMIIAYYIDENLIDDINKSLVYPIIPLNMDDLDSSTRQQVAESVKFGKNIFKGYSNDQSILETYGICQDIYSNPAFIFKIASERKIYEQGKETNLFVLYYLTVVGFIIAIIGSLFFNRYVISRLVCLTNEVSRITLDGKFEHIQPSSAKDEIGILRKTINQMLAAIYAKTEALKEAHEALRIAKEEAEEANETKSRFLANMSHEIRTPLNGIMGMTDLTFMTTLTSQQRTYLEMVKYSGNILLNIINDILDISKIEADKIHLEKIEFNLRHSIEKLIRLAATRTQKDIEVLLDIDPHVPAYVIGDPMRLNQIILNLVNNAIKFTQKGEVCVTVKSNEKSGLNYIEFDVMDTGIGIESHKLKEIFEEFTQADSTITRKYGGTGLGLAISHQLIKAMGGEINVSSQVGRGSTFSFTIPMRSSITKSPNTIYKMYFKKKRILIIEKNSKVRNILSKICCEIHLEHIFVSSRHDALKALDHQGFDAMVVNLYMDNSDALELSKKASQITEGSMPTILLVTPTDMMNDKALMKDLNICNQIIKPILPSEFISTLYNTIHQVQRHVDLPLTPKIGFEVFENKTVLVVEDGIINKKIIVELLKKLKINVLTADNGADALLLFKNNHMDLIIMDIEMPVMDGFEAATKIKEECISLGKKVPIIAVTAYVLENEIQKCYAAGMDDYICKPMNLDTFYEKLVKYFRPSSGVFTSYINHKKLTDLVRGEEKFIEDLLFSFITSYPRFIFEAKDCLMKGNIIKCKKILHGLKGTVSSLFIEHGLKDIVDLEENISTLSLEVIEQKMIAIEVKLHEVAEYINLTYDDN